jgi:hypothetical protein
LDAERTSVPALALGNPLLAMAGVQPSEFTLAVQ